MRWVLAVFALLFAYAAEAAAADEGRFVEMDMASAHVPATKVTIWLPPGYDRNRAQRYPVLYLHDGQNVFFPKRSSFNKVWAADKAALALIRSRKVAPFIIVAADHPGATRFTQYFPTRVTNPELAKNIAAFAKAPLAGDAYLAFLADELKPRIDATYRTRPSPRFTATAGASMGGLISLYALGERADVFGRAAAVSIHWPLIDPKIADTMRPLILADWKRWITTRLAAPRGRKLWMDHGTATLDASYLPFSQPAETYLAGAGWQRGVDFQSKVYEGAEHEENAWAARLPELLGWLLADWKP